MFVLSTALMKFIFLSTWPDNCKLNLPTAALSQLTDDKPLNENRRQVRAATQI